MSHEYMIRSLRGPDDMTSADVYMDLYGFCFHVHTKTWSEA